MSALLLAGLVFPAAALAQQGTKPAPVVPTRAEQIQKIVAAKQAKKAAAAQRAAAAKAQMDKEREIYLKNLPAIQKAEAEAVARQQVAQAQAVQAQAAAAQVRIQQQRNAIEAEKARQLQQQTQMDQYRLWLEMNRRRY